jgi:hypothetical protein
MGYDIIGDVHGQDAKLKALLATLGYRVRDGAYRHPEARRSSSNSANVTARHSSRTNAPHYWPRPTPTRRSTCWLH